MTTLTDPAPITSEESSAVRSDYIDLLRAATIDALTDSLDAIERASKTLGELASGDVHDVELTDTPEGADVLAHVETASRALRAARALIPTD